MFHPLYVATSGLNALETEIGDITHNLSNSRTVAFKKGRTDKESLSYVTQPFADYLDQTIEQVPLYEGIPNQLVYGTGVRIAATVKDFSQGAVEVTNQPFDLAIQGDGLFAVRRSDGTTAYRRAGNFHVDNEGNVVDPNGHLLDPPLTLPSGTTQVVIRQDGTVLAAINNQKDSQEIGQIPVTRFANSAGLVPMGQDLFLPSLSSGEPQMGIAGKDGFGSINQFALESSNVDPISELMRMVLVQRVFDTVSKAIQAYEQMLASLDRIRQA